MRPLTLLCAVALSSLTSACLLSGAVTRTQRIPAEVTVARAVQLPSADPSTLRLALHGNLLAPQGPGVYLAEISPWPPEEGADGVRRAYVERWRLRFLGARPREASGLELSVEDRYMVKVSACPGHDRCEVMLMPGTKLRPRGWVLLPFAAIADLVTFPIQVPLYFYLR
jgi:hypothetical protein